MIWLQGVRPIWTGSAYNVPSASRPGALVHRCYKVSVWMCTCEAGGRGVFHWHTALINALERAEELAGLQDDGDAPDLTDREAERERRLAAIYAEADAWYMAA